MWLDYSGLSDGDLFACKGRYDDDKGNFVLVRTFYRAFHNKAITLHSSIYN